MLFSLSKSPGGHLPPRRAGVLEVREFHPGSHEGWTNGRKIVSQPKFLSMLRCARELRHFREVPLEGSLISKKIWLSIDPS